MTSPRPPIQVVEELADTTALILDHDFPFLADTIAERLVQQGCEVDRNPTIFRTYDYIILLGTDRKFRKEVKKKPSEFPLASRLKNRGKAVVVTNQAVDIPYTRNFPVKVFVLDSTRTFSADALATRILKALFTSKPLRRSIPEPVSSNAAPARRRENTAPRPTNHNRYRLRLALVVATITLFLSPLIIYTAALAASGLWIHQSINGNIPIHNRKQTARYAISASSIATSTGSFIGSIVSPFSPSAAEQLESTGSLVYAIAHTVNEGLEVEELIKQKFQILFREGNPEALASEIPAIQQRLSVMENYLIDAVEASKTMLPFTAVPIINDYYPLTPTLEDVRRMVGEGREAIVLIPQLMAFGNERTYLLLFQNNFELRPTGGFIGSFGLLTVQDGAISDIAVEDVYEADGQLKGAVMPPDPIRIHLNQPNWFLRDSNWNPDFSISAQQAEWFLEKELGTTVDGVIAVDLYFVKRLLEALDGVYVPGYKARVTGQDFFVKLQSDTHDDFFPGSNEKKNLLSALLTALTIELKDRKTLPYPKIAEAVTTSLTRKHILLYFHDLPSQKVVEKLGWGGKLITPAQPSSSIAPVVLDYTMLVEANVGVNKANYAVKREIINMVSASENTINREVTVYYKNSSDSDGIFSGQYKNYLRVLLPESADIKKVRVGEQDLSLDTDITVELFTGKKIIGFLVEVPQQHELKTVIHYTLPAPVSKQFSYYLIMQKQPGTDQDPFVFKTGSSTGWDITTTTIPSLPYLSDLSVDRLMSLDFARQIK